MRIDQQVIVSEFLECEHCIYSEMLLVMLTVLFVIFIVLCEYNGATRPCLRKEKLNLHDLPCLCSTALLCCKV